MQTIASFAVTILLQEDGVMAIDMKSFVDEEIPPGLHDHLAAFIKSLEGDATKRIQEQFTAALRIEFKGPAS